MNEPRQFHYSLFGLHIASSLRLPELVAGSPVAAPDIVVEFGVVRARGGYHSLLEFEGVARYLVSDGAQIVVQPDPGADERNIRLYLLGSAMGMLLHQRGLLPLHANAIEVDGCAIAFMGPSGAGKSTLAAWAQERGHRLIADDVCVVAFDTQGQPLAMPGLPRLRLWRTALEALGKSASAFERSYAGDEQYEKYDVPIAAPGATRQATPLIAIYLLGTAESFSVEPLAGVAAAETVFANTYRGCFVRSAGDPRDHLETCLQLIAKTPIYRVERCWGLADMDEQNEAMLAHARQTAESRAVA